MGLSHASHTKESAKAQKLGLGCREVRQVVALFGKDVHLYELWSQSGSAKLGTKAGKDLNVEVMGLQDNFKDK